jgi:predicted nucleotidyltransferase component of viral defense system
MISIDVEIQKTKLEGFTEEAATAKVCQDIILNAISRSSLSKNVTIKGGVVMRSISQNARRATQDVDIDFIRYSLADDSIRYFVEKLNNIEGLKIELYGKLEELKQQDYHGKRAFIRITDSFGFEVTSKVDLGVHKHLDIKQEEFCFDIALQNDGVSLLINSKEQMFTEKLRSILKFGTRSTRYKDIFDLYWLSAQLDNKVLLHCFDIYIFSDPGMKENTIEDIQQRIRKVLENQNFRKLVSASKKNWLDTEDDQACDGLVNFLATL